MKNSGIYKIVNTVTQDCYVGSAVCIQERWWRHKKDLRKAKNHHSVILQRAWDKYGEAVFKIKILEHCTPEQLCDRENYWLQKLRPIYNICPTAYSQVGRKLSPEHVEKIRAYTILSGGGDRMRITAQLMRKKVIKLNYETEEEIERYDSLTQACESVGKDYTFVSTISRSCKGIRKSAFGYKWKFAEPSEEI